jgi:hypothetical protein
VERDGAARVLNILFDPASGLTIAFLAEGVLV